MRLGRRMARREQAIDRFQRPVAQPGIAPQLRRKARADRASEACAFVAGSAAVLPQDMCWADQPVIVQRHQPHGRLAHVQHAGAAHQRDVVEVQDVEPGGEKALESWPVEPREPRLLTDERGEQPRRASNSAHDHPVFPARDDIVTVLAADEIGLGRSDHIDFMPLFDQRLCQTSDVGRVSAIAERRIEGRDHAEAHQAARRAWISRRSSIRAPLLAQLNSADRGRHSALSRACAEAPATSTITLAMSSGSWGSKNSPAGPTTSATAPPWVAITGVPQAIASAAGRPKPSLNAGMATTIASE